MISVIIPMYNASKTIRRCLYSVMEQTYTDLEIIVIDDGSTDDSLRIVAEMEAEDQRIRCYKKSNGGVSSARNMGILKSSGDYLCFLDSDDAITRDYVKALIEEMTLKKSDITMCGYRDISLNKQQDHVLTEDQFSELRGTIQEDLCLLREFSNSPCMKMFLADIIREHQLLYREDMVTAEDQYFNYQYMEYCRTVSFVNRPIYVYYTGESDLSVRRTRKCFENELENLAFAKAFMERRKVINGMQMIGRSLCYAVRRYIFLTDEKNDLSACRKRLQSLRQILHEPIHLYKWQDDVIYQLLFRRLYTVLCMYLWCRLRLLQ